MIQNVGVTSAHRVADPDDLLSGCRDSIRSTDLILVAAAPEDMPSLTRVAAASYPPSLRPLCLETLDFHARCLEAGLDDGRLLFSLRLHGETIGGCGLHRYIWAPPTICWGSWYFIHPEFRDPQRALFMFRCLKAAALERGFEWFYVETPSADPEYARVSRYLPRAGFSLVGQLTDYYGPAIDQLIFRLNLRNS